MLAMLVRTVVVAPLSLAFLGLLVSTACQEGGEEGGQSATPTTQVQTHQRLEQFSTADLLSLGFPDATFEEASADRLLAAYVVQEEPGWRIETLGRLVGRFTGQDQPQLAAFVYLRGPQEGQEGTTRSRVLGLPEGLFVAFVELDARGQAGLIGWCFLHASGFQLLDVSTALEEDVRPLRQEAVDAEPGTSITPAVAVDTDNDGLDEIVLLDAGTEDGIVSARYLTFLWSGAGLSWDRLDSVGDGGEADPPTQIVLDYLAAVHSATSTAAHWEDVDRALVLGWLSGDETTVPEDLLEALVGDGPASKAESVRRELEATRELFQVSFAHWSAASQERQPWPDFINGFRTATGVAVEEMSAPSQKEEVTVVEVVVTAGSREGPHLVQRRFRVSYELIWSEEGWRLDSADAREERGEE